MGHEGFYKFLLAAMGNVVSALLMYALQAAWLCQRLIDQDYRQNHGSRLTPITDNKDIKKPLEIISSTSEFILPKNVNYKWKPSRHSSRTRKLEASKENSSRSHMLLRENRRRHKSRTTEKISSHKLNSSHSYLENVVDASAVEYLNGMNQVLGLRRAYSDINLRSNWFDFKEDYSSQDQNFESEKNGNETAILGANPDLVSLIFTKEYVT